MNLKTIVGAIVVAVLLFFGIIFAIAASVEATVTRLVVAAFLFIAAFGIAYYIAKKPTTIVQRVELSGQIKPSALKCPNCGGAVDEKQIKIVSGVPYATCPYCGQTFEVTEEPKW